MPDGKIIAERATYQSFIEFLDEVGYERVAKLGLFFGKYPIVSSEPINNRYKQANAHWYVLANWPTVKCAQYINDIADLSFQTLMDNHNFAENSISYGYRHKITHSNNYRVPGTANQRRISPESLGYILQRIVDLLSTAGTSETVNSIRKLLDGFKVADQAITALSKWQPDRNHIYANITTLK